ncbi:hypothetical protein ES703_10848 [subsurface metagenome]
MGIEPLELSLRSEIGVVVSPKELESVPQMISDLILNRVAYKKKIAELRNAYVYDFGHSSEIGAEYIVNIVGGMEENIAGATTADVPRSQI